MSYPPIFLVGVPRSGTTLLRMLIDSHPDIMCGPEAPWIAGRGIRGLANVRDLTLYLTENEWGAANSLTGVDQEMIYKLMASVIDEIMSTAVRSQLKCRWADKTPENIVAVPFLHHLFPDAKFVHIFRDGRDVALSTQERLWEKISFQTGRSRRVKNTYSNALKRWVSWIKQFHVDVERLNVSYLSTRYEDLVCSPREEMQKILDFLEVRWSDQVLNPHERSHDTVDRGEGVKSFYRRQSIDTQSLYRWKSELNWFQKRLTKAIAEEALVNLGYGPTV